MTRNPRARRTVARRAGSPVGVAALCLLGVSSSAQVVLDGTLGPSGPVGLVGSDYPIGAKLGRQVGGNLFHSFGAFSVDSGLICLSRSAYCSMRSIRPVGSTWILSTSDCPG